MNDLISRAALIAELEGFKLSLGDVILRFVVDRVIERVEEMPAADAVEVVHGRNLNDTPSQFDCSVCGWSDWDTYTGDTDEYNYCPSCGAKMDAEVRP